VKLGQSLNIQITVWRCVLIPASCHMTPNCISATD